MRFSSVPVRSAPNVLFRMRAINLFHIIIVRKDKQRGEDVEVAMIDRHQLCKGVHSPRGIHASSWNEFRKSTDRQALNPLRRSPLSLFQSVRADKIEKKNKKKKKKNCNGFVNFDHSDRHASYALQLYAILYLFFYCVRHKSADLYD